jgi:uncharacterized membrane protein
MKTVYRTWLHYLSIGCLTFAAMVSQIAHAETPPRALVVVGPWGDLFRWQPALHSAGLLYDDAYRAMNVYHGGVRVYGLPATADEYAKYSTIVLANMDAPTLGPKQLALLQEFVERGGGLVVLGGEWAFARGGYADTPLAQILPVTMPVENRIPVDRGGALLVAAPAPSWKIDVSFGEQPRAYYTQTLVPKPGAVVELKAGEAPAIVSGRFGKGRVVACALTIHGTPQDGRLPFWDWAAWPQVLGAAIDWSAADAPATPSAASSLKPLSEEDIRQVQFHFQPLTEEFVNRFAAAPSAPAAQVIFEHLFAAEPVRVPLTQAVVDGLARYAEPSWEKSLRRWCDSLNPESRHRNAAIELLGAARAPDAAAVLVPLLGDVDAQPAAIDGLRRLGDPQHIAILSALYERLLPKTDFRNPDGKSASGPPAQRAGVAAVHAAAALYALGEPTGPARMAGLYRDIRLLRRIMANAAKRRVADTDAQGQGIRKAIIEKRDDLRQLEAFLLSVAGPVPEVARPALVEFARTATDDAEVRWTVEAMVQTPGGDWSAATNATDGIVRRVARTPSTK